MPKLLLIYRINKDDASNAGVIKKCRAQCKAFRKLGLDVDMIWLCNNGVLLNDRLIFQQHLQSHSLHMYWFYLRHFALAILKNIDFTTYDLIYFRHPCFDPSLVFLLRKAKRVNPYIITILEINTWPYSQEPKRFLYRASLFMDTYYQRYAYQFIDVIAHYGKEEKIWNIPVIPIRNGIAVDAIPLKSSANATQCIRLIAVGNWSYWHGLDRLINGLAVYKSRGGSGVELTIVGGGNELRKYRRMIEDKGLEEVIQCVGEATGVQLDTLFESADIGIGTLAILRKGVALDSSLKHREYCARGLPMVLSAPDPDFPRDLPFVHYVPNNEETIDIENLIIFFNKLKGKMPTYPAKIRRYAKENLSWEKQLEPVIDWLKQKM